MRNRLPGNGHPGRLSLSHSWPRVTRASHSGAGEQIRGYTGGSGGLTGTEWVKAATLEADTLMNDNSESGPSFPFVPADADIDMIDKFQPSTNGGSSYAAAPSTDALDMARQLAATIQSLITQAEQEAAKRQAAEAQVQVLSSQMRAMQESARAGDALRQTLRETGSSNLSMEDLQKLHNVLQALSQDPNHIMVLAAVAQQANKLLELVNAFSRIYPVLK